tara:strand:- start:667 stop:1365 length:699 start_codon:yes stop_codon:yes gene_type:complete
VPKIDGVKQAENIARVLRNAIIEQALPAGSRLPEDSVADQFHTSRSVVREALSMLSTEGLVEHRKNRGAFVAEPVWEEARDLFDLRISLEKIVVARLPEVLTDDQLDRLRAHVATEELARDEGHDSRSIRLGGEFHVALAEMTGSDFFLRYTRELTSRCSVMLALYSRPVSVECGVSEHFEIIDLIAAGKHAQAVLVMERHLFAVVERAMIKPRTRDKASIAEVLAKYKNLP